MRKIIALLMPFIVSACIPMTTMQQRLVPREKIREIKTKAEDTSRTESLAFKELDGYFLKNSVKLVDDVNFFVISSQKIFDNFLRQSKTITDVAAFPDFKNNLTVIIAMKPSQILNDIKIVKAYFIENDIYIEYEIVPQSTPEIGYFTSNVKTFEIEKSKQVLNVSFVDTNKNMTILPFGRRTAASPVSIDALLKYYTGRYKGTIPAADDAGIAMILTLSNDYTYRLEQSYLSNPARTFESAGKWSPSDDLSFFVLDYDKPTDEQMAFYFLGRSIIEKLDIYHEKIETSPELYRLKK
ncbi:MAG: copper resistance protein NlpE [Endomicrobium sp.]|jgi:hypothetical protein|nr:copper resistance protein NlpE [Endomicrobium sp.]